MTSVHKLESKACTFKTPCQLIKLVMMEQFKMIGVNSMIMQCAKIRYKIRYRIRDSTVVLCTAAVMCI